MTPTGRLSAAELGKFLEIQNLGLNLPFAGAFLLLAAHGAPPLGPTALLIIAFVAARNAGHAFNRWTDRAMDAANPRTQGRALVTGRVSPRFALALVGINALVLFLAAAWLNLLALVLAPVALAIVLGYSLTKRLSPLTTVVLGLVESITPAAVYIGLTGALPPPVLLAVLALLAWGTAFESIHSLGDLDADRRLGLPSLPASLGVRGSVILVPTLHATGLALLAAFGLAEHLPIPYFAALAAMAAIAGVIDYELARDPSRSQRPFRAHFVLGGIYLVGAAISVLF
ncbi:MAG: UbiA family prenyltransferase [Thermoplasmata archaeon]|nr:UbiA family prenyltransferase [Thermoplasmata archaeon]MCI4354014.1 UbiA family prenyltransferase [Thermoplasmata archaeon]